ncbi:putative RNA polymerase sigma factor [Labilithrix luteola]|uniref:Putative RNA polymerase sigma factor n=1 Tax=Labilithrix luteola TaxID=1391654 RepID=A0A0K1QC96_9BACT|nr:sigma-70 family RNA polymerase sigma factor [Labilithrix luteola]AKV03348.1 putative RNA polymerase sigma factor [Labilithrix luteola]
MEERDLAARFEENRSHLRGVAYRMLGSLAEADDAVQESWFRLSRADTGEVENFRGWLTTVVGRICLDMLRSRKTRAEEDLESPATDARAATAGKGDPEQESLFADSVGLALLVVLETLEPAERLAFVLHDLFSVPFEEIATIVGRSPDAARQLASRARRRVRGAPTLPEAELESQRGVVAAFLAALRSADLDGLLAVLDPELVVRGDFGRGISEVRGAANWAKGAVLGAHGAPFVEVAIVDGSFGLVFAPRGKKVVRALTFRFANGKVTSIEVIADRARLDQMEFAAPA